MEREYLIDALMFVLSFFRHEAEEWIDRNKENINYFNITGFSSAVNEVYRVKNNKL